MHSYNVIIVTCSEDVLVFMTGQEEIEATVRSIKDIAKDLPTGIFFSHIFTVHQMYCRV